jgi:two-component system sensor histidine kinase TctE
MLVELEREGQGGPSRLDSMDVELKEMDSLVGQLLAQSRLEFQNMDLREVPASELAKTALERAGIPTRVLVDETAGATVRADVSLIGRALLNLLDNAEKHGRGLRRFTLKPIAGAVEFEIWDKGPGFDANLLPRALEAFVGSTKTEGLGLGLSLVQRIVQAHAGYVGVANSEQGAVVSIRLPLAKVDR